LEGAGDQRRSLRRLFDKHDLGVHTEMFPDGVVERAELLVGIAHPDFRAELRKAFAAARHVALGPAHP
jgi:acyl-CoA hydrolase